MSIEGCALQLLRACQVNSAQLIQFLQPYGNRLPTTEAQFRELQSSLRRVGHIVEHAPSNIASSLHGDRQARPGQYLAQEAAYNTNSPSISQLYTDGYDNQPEAFGSDAQPAVVQPQGESTSFWGGAEQGSWGWAYPVQQHDDLLTDESSSGTSSDSGNEYVEMSHD